MYWQDYSVTTSREYVTLINVNLNKGGKVFTEIAKGLPEYKFLGVKGEKEEKTEKQKISERQRHLKVLAEIEKIKLKKLEEKIAIKIAEEEKELEL